MSLTAHSAVLLVKMMCWSLEKRYVGVWNNSYIKCIHVLVLFLALLKWSTARPCWRKYIGRIILNDHILLLPYYYIFQGKA